MSLKTILFPLLTLSVIFASAQSNPVAEGIQHYNKGEYQKALEYLNKNTDSTFVCEALKYKADSYRHLGKYNLAIQYFEQNIKECKPDYHLYLNLGDAYYKNKRVDDAHQTFLRAYDMNPHNFELNYNIGLTNFQNGDLQEAKTYARKATRLNPENVEAFELLSEIHNGLDEFDSSLLLIEKLHLEKPGHRTLLLKAYLHGHKGDYKKCVNLLTEVLKHDPSNLNAYHNRYLAYFALNNKRKACSDYKKVRSLDPSAELENYFECK